MRRGAGSDKPFLEHLDDLRSCIVRMLAVWAICTLVVIPFCPALLDLLTHPLQALEGDIPLRAIHFGSGMKVLLQLTLWGGLGLSLPFQLAFLAQFVFPGLTPGEKRMVSRLTLLAGLLFALGAFLGYHLTLPLAIRFFFGVSTWLGAEMDWVELSDYVVFSLKLMVTFGLAFELPVLLLGLGYTGLVSTHALRRYRRGVLIGIFVFAMILTPPDPLSQLLMALPLYGMYEICILLIGLKEKTQA